MCLSDINLKYDSPSNLFVYKKKVVLDFVGKLYKHESVQQSLHILESHRQVHNRLHHR